MRRSGAAIEMRRRCLRRLLMTIAAGLVIAGGASGQTLASDPLPPKPRTSIPPPRQFTLTDRAVGT